MNIILMGKPGAGKGTQAQRLCQDYPFKIIASGDIIRQTIKDKTPLGLKIKEHIDNGNLLDDETMLDIIIPEIEKNSYVLLDGFPRTIAQAEALSRRKKIDLVIFLHVDDEIVTQRISNRWMVNHNGKQLSFTSKDDAQAFAQKEGGDVFQRNDDTREVIKKRLMNYQKETKPLLSYYYHKGILCTVDGYRNVEEVNTDICQRIEKIK